jgi:hypothetical protein
MSTPQKWRSTGMIPEPLQITASFGAHVGLMPLEISAMQISHSVVSQPVVSETTGLIAAVSKIA